MTDHTDGQTAGRARDRLSEAKRLLLQKRLHGQVKAGTAGTIRRRERGPVQPMSYAQERLWFLDQLDPGQGAYNIPVAYLVSAKIDVATLEKAFTEIVRRHESLRTVFRMVDGEPRQIILDPFPITVEQDDLRGPDGEDADEESVRRRIGIEGARPFDLSAGPLVRVGLFRVSRADCALLVNIHHIVTDGWSMPIVTREMDELYHAFAHGRPSPLAEVEVQYADYSAWQREYLTGATLQKQLDFWRTHLEGAPTLDLPTDRPRPPVLSHRGGIHRFVWPASTVRAAQAAMVETGATMNMVVMAAFYLALHRYSGQDDVVLGTLLGNRNRAETEYTVGFFVNSAPVRARLRREMTFRDLVAQVRTSVLDADAHQDLPFDKMVDELKTERDPSRNPLFQVMYFHHTFVSGAIHHKEDSEFASELNLRSLFQETGVTLVDTEFTKFDMTIATLEQDGVLTNMVEYSTDLWDDDSIGRMMEHVRLVLESGCAAPDAPLPALAMTSPAERDTLLAWGTDARGFPRDESAVSLFRAQAERTPDARAAEYGDDALTYAELDAGSTRIARRLRGMGVGAGDRVALATAPSVGTLAALLGILKAGAAAVPVDPDYPAERQAFMLRDTAARVVVGQAGSADAVPHDGIAILDLARDADAIAAESAGAMEDAPGADAIAYVLFTSGSTGTPKGVRVPHRAVVRTTVGTDVALEPGDRVAQGASLSFDAALWEVWVALLNGGTVVGLPREVLLSSPDYAAWLRAHDVTVAFATTQVFNRHVREVPGVYAALRWVIFGGEAVDPEAVRLCLANGPAHLLHAYGPTEGTTYATMHACAGLADDAPTVPIGRPVANTRVYVLDPAGALAGIGVPGELCVGGDGVAAGYLDRPALTAERFVPDPFAGGEARMYRTGDRARWRADGTLEFLGRMDQQVKVRGFRIEPGEVEAALRAHPAVAGCAVVAREDAPGDRRLVAYVVGEGAEAADFRPWLKERLPDYMVPSAFVALDAIPLTANGKVDHRRLPAPEAPARSADGFAAPRTEAEAVLAELWAEALRMERVGIHDNFFSLGGDSILSIQIIARAAQRGLRITPRQMFVHQTIADLAAVAQTGAAARAAQGPATGPAPLTPVQHWFFAAEHPHPAHYNLAEAFDLTARVDAEAMARAVAAVAAHHDALRARFVREGDAWRQEIAEAGDEAPFETLDLSAVAPAERESAFTAAADALHASLDLAAGPLLRAELVEMGPDDPQRLLLTAHHLVTDAVSLGVIAADLEAAYAQAARGEAIALPPKTTSFRAWGERLAAHAASPEARAERAFWIAQGRKDVAPLPTDRAGGDNAEGAADYVTVSLDEETTRALLQEVPPVYGTRINDALLAALARAFGGWTGGAPLRVDVEGHGREDLFEGVDLTRTAGWFTAIHPLRIALPEGGPGEALKAVKEAVRAVPAKGIGFGVLRWLGDDETRAAMAALPRPQVSFNYLGQVDGRGGGSGLLAPSDADVGTLRAPDARRPHLLAVDALVSGGALHVTWTYGTAIHDRATVERLAAAYLDALREIVAHCRDPQAGGYTPSDFDLAGLDQEGLDALLANY